MSHNAYLRSGNVWAADSVIAHGEAQSIDALLYKSINGDDGGIWAPASAIVIGGAGLTVTGVFTADGNWAFSGGDGDIANCDVTASGATILHFETGTKLYFETGSTGEVQDGAIVNVKSLGTLHVESGGYLTAAAGSHVTLSGGASFPSGATLEVASGGTLEADAGSSVILPAPGTALSGSGNLAYQTPRAFTRLVAPHAVARETNASGTRPAFATQNSGQRIAAFEYVVYYLSLPLGATITALDIVVSAHVVPGSWGHSANVSLRLYSTDANTTTDNPMAAAVFDPSTTGGAYGTPHVLALTPGSGLPGGGFTVAEGTLYSLMVVADNDATAPATVDISVPRMTGTLPALRVV